MQAKKAARAPASGGSCCASSSGLVFAFLMLPLLVLFPISFSSGSYLRFPPPAFRSNGMRVTLAMPPGSTPPIAACRSAPPPPCWRCCSASPSPLALRAGAFVAAP